MSNPTEASRSERRMLVIFPGALGDLICAGPALRALGRMNPDAAVDLMARAELADLAAGRMGVERGYSIDRREVSAMFREDGTGDPAARKFFGRFARIWSFFAFDAPIYCRTLSQVSGGPVTFHQFRPSGAGHISDLYLKAIGAQDLPRAPRIDLTIDDLEAASEAMVSLNLTPDKFLMIFPGSGSANKNWDEKRFARLALEIEDRMRLRPLAVLGPAENDLKPLFRDFQIATISMPPLASVAALAQSAAGFVGNDSGVSHLAAAAGARGVVIFGPSDPARWRPLGRVTVMRASALEALTVEQVARPLEDALRSIDPG
ncbi:MAG TPA: glycosyltransferase family 9 protein [Candidatus Binataceae bacterium]|nr:glycosyltransferase family 9 protein [Candidatus Binataceae bacterium]